MWSFNSKSEPNQTNVVFDIRSGAVAAAVYQPEAEKNQISWHTKKTIKGYSERNPNRALDKLIDTIAAVGAKVIKDGLSDVDEDYDVAIFVAEPWHIGGPQVITTREHTPFALDQSFHTDILEHAREEFITETLDRYQAEENNLSTLESLIVKQLANGYEIPTSEPRKTTQSQHHTYVSLWPRQVKEKITAAFREQFNDERLVFLSHTGALIRWAQNHKKSQIIADVSRESTHVHVFNDGALKASSDFSIGSENIVQTLQELRDVPAADARSRARKYFAGELEDAQIKTAIDKLRNHYTELFSDAVTAFGPNVSVPRTMSFFAANELGSNFADFISKMDARKHLIDENNFNVTKVGSRDILPQITQASDISSHLAAGIQALSVGSFQHSEL